MAQVRVLFIGLDPKVIDFADPDQAVPGLTAEKIQAGIDSAVAQLRQFGYAAEFCPVDHGETAEAVVRARLASGAFDCIAIGAGIRLFAKQTELLEKLVNAAHAQAPKAKIAFNTTPADTAQAVQRWFPRPT